MAQVKDGYFEGWEDGTQDTYYENIYTCGKYRNGLKEGEWRSYYDEDKKRIRFIDAYINNVKEGISEEYDEYGDLLALYFYQNGTKGFIVDNVEYYQYDSVGDKNVGKFVRLKKVGIWKCYCQDGRIEEANYNDGEICCILHYYDNKLLNGSFKSRYENNGHIAEYNYKNGKLNGICRWYYETGKLEVETNYTDGKENGMVKEYYETGNLNFEGIFKDGKENGIVKEYYKNGNLRFEEIFKEGKRNGLCRWYYENGNLDFEGIFKDGKRNGLCRWYYENGKLEQESYYINGKKNGISEKYYENGNIKSERNYMEEKGDGNHKGECPYKWEYFAKKLKKEDILKKYCEKENMQEAIFCMIEKTEDLCICYH